MLFPLTDFLVIKDLPVVAVLFAGSCLSVYTKKLTGLAACTGFICGLLIYLGGGYTGLILLSVFFLAGTIATSWGRQQKQGLERTGDSSQRKYGQVLANGGTATIMAVLALIFKEWSMVFLLMLAASLASATADTLSSELGMLYGKRFYNCITWQKDERGLDGVISFEGTLIGLAGAILIAVIFSITYGISISSLIIVIAGASGNYADSLFGASLERKKILGNNWVNFLSTSFAAVVALLFYLIFKRF